METSALQEKAPFCTKMPFAFGKWKSIFQKLAAIVKFEPSANPEARNDKQKKN